MAILHHAQGTGPGSKMPQRMPVTANSVQGPGPCGAEGPEVPGERGWMHACKVNQSCTDAKHDCPQRCGTKPRLPVARLCNPSA
eukprot:3653127-Alexandrium_andersonii.AAC.1